MTPEASSTAWASTNDGTRSRATLTGRPSSTRTRASTLPPAVSRRTTVSGSRTGTSRSATSVVATPMVAWPQPGRKPSASANTTRASWAASTGGSTNAAYMASWPRGSRTTAPRSAPAAAVNDATRSATVAPWAAGAPSSTTRVGMPSVWLSTTRTVLVATSPAV